LKSLHSSQAPLPENNFRVTGNNARYMNPEFDALIERFHVTVPMRERTEILGQLIYHIADQLPQLPLFYDAEPVFINNRVAKAAGKTLRSSQAWNVHEWDVGEIHRGG
jgi:ABC-type oligopeptide transport system substrate-binding subunit